MQALVLVGGEGTRLRPLTSNLPKPAIRLVDRPFLRFMVEWLARHGVDEVVLACGFKADRLRAVLGDGGDGGPRLRYVEEPEPRGTAGAIKFAEDHLEERFLALNGDVLADLDLTALVHHHEAGGAVATLGLHPVDDPTGYGLISTDGEGRITEFLEKPEPGHGGPGEINAGTYVLDRSVLESIPADREVSIEREVFPRMVGAGLHGLRLEGYWVDIGTPERYLQASWDILEQRVETAVAERIGPDGRLIESGAEVDPEAGISGPALIESGARVAAGASIGPRAVIARGCEIGAGARVEGSILHDGCRVGEGAAVRGAILAPGAEVAAAAVLEGGVIGEGELVGDDDAEQRGRSPRLRGERQVDLMMSDLEAKLRDLDSGGQLAAARAIPDHLRDALWRIESARLEDGEGAGALVCGMGGSAIGGDLAAAALGDRCARPLLTVRGYALPAWATPEWTVLCCSYSGATEETLASFEAVQALGARCIAATTGGPLADAARAAGVPVVGLPGTLQPRAAVAYMFAMATEIAAVAGAAPRIHSEIEAAARGLEDARERLEERAGEIAERLAGSVPVIYGGGLTAPVAYRWKTQINENAKLAAFSAVLPEADHNELEGWAGGPGLGAIFLEDADQHPRERRRFELTAELVAEKASATVRIETEGSTPSERLLWAVMLGDLVSLHLAAAHGVDPTPVGVIERFKDELGRP